MQHAEGKFVRQSGGRGQYGHAVIDMEPNEEGKGYEFENAIGSIFLTRLLYADLVTLCKSTHSQLFTFQPLLFSFCLLYTSPCQ